MSPQSTAKAEMNRFCVWGLVRRIPDGRYRVRVRAIPLADGIPFESSDELTDIVGEVAEATGRRDEMASRLKRLITQRGDHVASVDLTFEI